MGDVLFMPGFAVSRVMNFHDEKMTASLGPVLVEHPYAASQKTTRDGSGFGGLVEACNDNARANEHSHGVYCICTSGISFWVLNTQSQSEMKRPKCRGTLSSWAT